MKQIYVILCLGFLCFAIGKEFPVNRELTANIYNDFLSNLIGQGMRLNYDTEQGTFLWYVDYTIFPVAIQFTDTVRHTLSGYIEKYKEWNKKASEKGLKVDKEIGELPATAVYFKYGDGWEKDSRATIHVKFFSQDAQKHQMIVYFETLESDYNEYTKHKPDALYFWWNDVVRFETAISENSVNQYLSEVEKKQSIEEDFK
jgi:hypothetical protein